MHEVIEGLADHQPSRAVVLCGEPEGEGLDAMVSTSCRISGEHNGVALETVRLTLRGEAREGAASATVPLLRSDLPTVLWWPWAPDRRRRDGPLASARGDRRPRRHRVGPCGRPGARPCAPSPTGCRTPPPRSPTSRGPRITGWRQLIAQMVEGESLGNLRAGPATTLIVHAPGPPGADALLLAGWLRDAIGPGLTVTLEAREDEGGPGIVAVELESSVARRLVVERAAGRDAAAVCVTERRRHHAQPGAPPAPPGPGPPAGRRAGAAAARPRLRARARGSLRGGCRMSTERRGVVVVKDLPTLADRAAARIERVALDTPAGSRATIALAGGIDPEGDLPAARRALPAVGSRGLLLRRRALRAARTPRDRTTAWPARPCSTASPCAPTRCTACRASSRPRRPRGWPRRTCAPPCRATPTRCSTWWCWGWARTGTRRRCSPDRPSVEVTDRLMIPVHRPEMPQPWRVSMTLPVLNAAKRVLMVVGGGAKAPMVRRAIAGDPSIPAGRLDPAGTLTWLLTGRRRGRARPGAGEGLGASRAGRGCGPGPWRGRGRSRPGGTSPRRSCRPSGARRSPSTP